MSSQTKANAAPAAGPVNNTAKLPNAKTNSGNSSTSGGIKEKLGAVKDFLKSDTGMVIMIACTILLFVLVIVYITFSMKSSNLKGKILIQSPIKLNELSSAYEIAEGVIPKPAVGREYSYSFWMYLENFEQSVNSHKLIFYRGNNGSVTTANPVVFMDKDTNKLYLAVKTQNKDLAGTTSVNYNNLTNITEYNYFYNRGGNKTYADPAVNMYTIMSIDYIPLQRWVNVVLIADNKLLTLYMDGEIYSVKSMDEFKAMREPELDPVTQKPLNISLILDKQGGSIYAGKSAVGQSTTIDGYLSKLEFHNYALSINDVKAIYRIGPLGGTGLLGSIGIPYRLRSPLYKIGEDK